MLPVGRAASPLVLPCARCISLCCWSLSSMQITRTGKGLACAGRLNGLAGQLTAPQRARPLRAALICPSPDPGMSGALHTFIAHGCKTKAVEGSRPGLALRRTSATSSAVVDHSVFACQVVCRCVHVPLRPTPSCCTASGFMRPKELSPFPAPQLSSTHIHSCVAALYERRC